MPSDGMGLRPFQNGPDRHIKTRPTRQRPVMKIDRPKHGPRDQCLGQNSQVGHRKQPVKPNVTQIWQLWRAKMRNPRRCRPRRDVRIRGDHPAHLPTRLLERLCALDQKRPVSTKYCVHCSTFQLKNKKSTLGRPNRSGAAGVHSKHCSKTALVRRVVVASICILNGFALGVRRHLTACGCLGQ